MRGLHRNFIALANDENGAAFLEYTVLLGIILATSIALVFAVGSWANSIWMLLCTQLDASALANCAPAPTAP